MNTNRKKALIKDLIANGWGDFVAHESWAEGGVAMSGETYNDTKGVAGDYYGGGSAGYDDFGINEEINKIADKRGCFAEWINPGVFGLYEV